MESTDKHGANSAKANSTHTQDTHSRTRQSKNTPRSAKHGRAKQKNKNTTKREENTPKKHEAPGEANTNTTGKAVGPRRRWYAPGGHQGPTRAWGTHHVGSRVKGGYQILWNAPCGFQGQAWLSEAQGLSKSQVADLSTKLIDAGTHHVGSRAKGG